MIPGAAPIMAAAAFLACGAGFDLLHEVLDGAAVPADGPAIQASAISVGARHAGLVLGLACLTPAGFFALFALPVWTFVTSIALYRAQNPARLRAHHPAPQAG